MKTIVCRPMKESEVNRVFEVAQESFMEAVALYFTKEGVREFLPYSSFEAM